MSKKKYTKCQCCPYYALDFADKKWKCARVHIWGGGVWSCVFSCKDTAEECAEIINRWINANKD